MRSRGSLVDPAPLNLICTLKPMRLTGVNTNSSSTSSGPSGKMDLHQLSQKYRRPKMEGKWWSIPLESWRSIRSTTRLKTLEHIGRIMETSDGVDAPFPCKYCASKNHNDCRVYSGEAHQKRNTRTGCAHCIRAKTNTRCSHAAARTPTEIDQLSKRVSTLEDMLSSIENSSSPQQELGEEHAWIDVWMD